jgi:hypothetical protein
VTARSPLWPTRVTTLAAAASFLLVAAATPPVVVAADDGVTAVAAATRSAVRLVRVPDGGVFPQAQTDARGTIHLTYTKGDPAAADVYYARSTDGGDTFSPPVRVNREPGGAVVVGTVRGPQMAVGRDGRVHVAWMGSGKAAKVATGAAAADGTKAAGRHTPMWYARTTDDGRAFEPERDLVGAHPGLDGGGSVAADRDGNVYVAWHAPAEPGGGEADRRVWIARSRDDGKTFAPEVAADPTAAGVCACCGMKVAAGDGGAVYVVYRSATEAVHRDVHMVASADHGRTFADVAAHPWEVAQCVMSTAAVAPTADGNAVGRAGGVAAGGGRSGEAWAAWETRKQIYFARLKAPGSRSAGRASDFEVRTVPGEGRGGRRHPSVAAAADGRFCVAWTEGTAWNKGGVVAWQVFGPDGTPVVGEAGRADGVPAWGVPAVVVAPDGTFRVLY